MDEVAWFRRQFSKLSITSYVIESTIPGTLISFALVRDGSRANSEDGKWKNGYDLVSAEFQYEPKGRAVFCFFTKKTVIVGFSSGYRKHRYQPEISDFLVLGLGAMFCRFGA
jgi:hypothetical protein